MIKWYLGTLSSGRMFICWIFSRPHVSEENLISDGPQEHLCYRTRLKWIVIERIFRAYHSLGARIWARPDQILVPLRTTYNTTNTSIGDCPCLPYRRWQEPGNTLLHRYRGIDLLKSVLLSTILWNQSTANFRQCALSYWCDAWCMMLLRRDPRDIAERFQI